MGKDRGGRGGRGRRNFQSKPYNKQNWRGQKKENSNGNDPAQPRKRGQQKKCTLQEHQVGITEFTNADIPGFTAILKSRFSDFHVNEIDPEGNLLQLNDTKVPKVEIEPVDPSLLEEWRQKLATVIDENMWQQIADLSTAIYDPVSEQHVDVNVTSLSKEQRTQIHHLIKQLYKGKLVSKTLDKQPPQKQAEEQQVPDAEEKKTIRILKPKPGRSDARWSFPHEYVNFLVHKVNMDTSEVAATLAQRLCLAGSMVNYCGTKDKRAKTTQRFCIKRRAPESIVKAARGMDNVYIGNFSFTPNTLKLGDLKGNRFRIALRHITQPREDIELELQSLKERGFINYYGLQRFGNSASVPTHEVGVALLKSDYKLACELILKPRDNDVEFMRAIRESWWENRDSAAAAAKFYGNKFIEKKVLDGLATYGENDYSAALRRIPRNMLILYPHAYQSLIFNRVASRRVKEFGLKLIPGDLVYVEEESGSEEPVPAVETEEVVMADALEGDADNLLEVEEESIFKRKVRPLTAEDIASNKYKLSDVVLPLPGYDIKYPGNDCAAWYEEMLAEVGLSSELLRTKEKTYALAGAYRKLLIETNDLTWSFRRYSTPEDTLIASDWEQLKNTEITPEPAETEGKYMALLLEFTLPTAVYATMFLRELFKQDTSSTTQMNLENEEISKKLAQETATTTPMEEAQPQPI